MKKDKAPGPSDVVTKMLKAFSDVCSKMITNLTNLVICDNIMLFEWNDSNIISKFKGKGEIYKENYCGLKLTAYFKGHRANH